MKNIRRAIERATSDYYGVDTWDREHKEFLKNIRNLYNNNNDAGMQNSIIKNSSPPVSPSSICSSTVLMHDTLDDNRDGKISLKEWLAHKNTINECNNFHTSGHTETSDATAEKAFNNADQNKDGFLSLKEIKDATDNDIDVNKFSVGVEVNKLSLDQLNKTVESIGTALKNKNYPIAADVLQSLAPTKKGKTDPEGDWSDFNRAWAVLGLDSTGNKEIRAEILIHLDPPSQEASKHSSLNYLIKILEVNQKAKNNDFRNYLGQLQAQYRSYYIDSHGKKRKKKSDTGIQTTMLTDPILNNPNNSKYKILLEPLLRENKAYPPK